MAMPVQLTWHPTATQKHATIAETPQYCQAGTPSTLVASKDPKKLSERRPPSLTHGIAGFFSLAVFSTQQLGGVVGLLPR